MRTLTTASDFDLQIVRDFFDSETCSELIGEMRRSPISAALTYGEGEAGVVDERVRKVARLMPGPGTLENVRRRLLEVRDKFENYFEIRLSSCEEPQFLRYGVGDFFVAHQDGNTGLVRLDSDQSRRISVSIFLNHQSDTPKPGAYGGGSLVFSDWRDDRQFQLAGETGMLVAFRSEITHEVVPVTRGARYSIVSWYG